MGYHVIHTRSLCVGHFNGGGYVLERICEDQILDGVLSVDEAAAVQLNSNVVQLISDRKIY